MAQGRLRESNDVGEDEAPSPNVARVFSEGLGEVEMGGVKQ